MLVYSPIEIVAKQQTNMKKQILSVVLSMLSACSLFAQYVLETPDGKKVKLNPDGSWQFITKKGALVEKTSVPKTSTAVYKSKFKKFALYYDPSQWVYDTTKKSNELDWDVTFHSKDFAITGYFMESRLSMPLESIEETLRAEWQQVGEIKSIKFFTDTINNLELNGFDMSLSYSGVNYEYRGYIYSTLRGSFQIIAGTQKEVFDEDKDKIYALFKGLMKL